MKHKTHRVADIEKGLSELKGGWRKAEDSSAGLAGPLR